MVPIPTTSSGPQGPTGQVNKQHHVLCDRLKPVLPQPLISSFPISTAASTPGPRRPTRQPWQRRVPRGLLIRVWRSVSVAGTPYLYAANGGTTPGIDVFNGTFTNVTSTTFAGKFVDPSLPAGLVPFNVQNIGGMIYVTYAPAGHAAETTATTGAVAVFDESGNLISSFTNSHLGAPWGITLAPSDFGPFSGDLLIGNFAYGTLSPVGGEINAYDPTSGAFEGTLDSNAAWQGLWALTFGSGSASGGEL